MVQIGTAWGALVEWCHSRIGLLNSTCSMRAGGGLAVRRKPRALYVGLGRGRRLLLGSFGSLAAMLDFLGRVWEVECFSLTFLVCVTQSSISCLIQAYPILTTISAVWYLSCARSGEYTVSLSSPGHRAESADPAIFSHAAESIQSALLSIIPRSNIVGTGVLTIRCPVLHEKKTKNDHGPNLADQSLLGIPSRTPEGSLSPRPMISMLLASL
jgi:hypothetical protein